VLGKKEETLFSSMRRDPNCVPNRDRGRSGEVWVFKWQCFLRGVNQQTIKTGGGPVMIEEATTPGKDASAIGRAVIKKNYSTKIQAGNSGPSLRLMSKRVRKACLRGYF